MHRHAERLALDVPQRKLNPCYRLGSDATRRLPRHAIHVPVARLNSARVLSQEYRFEILNRADDAVRVAPVRHLAVPGQTRICPDRAELPRSPTGINHERLNIRYPHRICSTDRIVTVAVCRPPSRRQRQHDAGKSTPTVGRHLNSLVNPVPTETFLRAD